MVQEPTTWQILLVDDESVFRETLAKVLRARGAEVEAVANGDAGIASFSKRDFDAVVLDLKMPGLDGLSTLRRMREIHPATPVIILTGHGSVSSGIDAIERVAYDFLLKPVSTDRLIQVIASAIEARRGTR